MIGNELGMRLKNPMLMDLKARNMIIAITPAARLKL
jgi:hypothetical protein